ncbi:MAG: biopolymer transporter ExbD [Planctomycetes bacterium]|nr:biopolymer transporter ExbD [Planctomycetota bacterium]
MAHGSAGEDNPVGLNVAPMVDIIFCLCIFFMCSFHFKQLEGKFEAWLPKDGPGNQPFPTDVVVIEEVRISMSLDASTQTVIRKIGSVSFPSNDELIAAVKGGLARHASNGQPNAPAIIDSMPNVPWKDVIGVLDLCKANGVTRIQMSEPFGPK